MESLRISPEFPGLPTCHGARERNKALTGYIGRAGIAGERNQKDLSHRGEYAAAGEASGAVRARRQWGVKDREFGRDWRLEFKACRAGRQLPGWRVFEYSSRMLSVVVPVFNEAESLPSLLDELRAVARGLSQPMEAVLVDDGSTDGSWPVIQRLANEGPDVRGIRLRRNFGKAAALTAGFRAANGELVLSLDADLQDDPAEIPKLLERLDQGLDVVSGWKQVRRDPWHKVWPSRVFNWLVSRLTGVKLHDHNCGLKLYRREVLREVRLYGELHRFVPVLAHARGFRVGEVVVAHRPRKFGRSKYGVARLLKGFLDLLTVKFLTGYGQRPSHVLGTAGFVLLAIGAAGLAYLAGYWAIARMQPELAMEPLHRRPALVYSLGALILGGQFLSIGLIAELITAFHGRDADTYSIAEETRPASDAVESVVSSPATRESAAS